MDDDTEYETSYQSGTMPKGPRIRPKKPQPVYLALWRESKKLTQEQLAERLGTTKGSISRWENDERVPSIAVAAAIAEALGIPIGALYRKPTEKTLDDVVHGAPDEIRNHIMDMAEFLMDKHNGKKS